jgi:hypothetical protein
VSPEKVAKIRALVDHPSTHPNTREVAIRMLLEAGEELAPPPAWTDVGKQKAPKQAPGVHPSQAWKEARFLDLSRWGLSAKGNLTTITEKDGIVFRVTIFQHKNGTTWGWSCALVNNPEIQAAFNLSPPWLKSHDEAHRDVCQYLQNL